MGILQELLLDENWQLFYEKKVSQNNLPKNSLVRLKEYIDGKEYVDLIKRILEGEAFSHAVKHVVNKGGTSRKRVVYSFTEEENFLLKAISFMLYKYDDIFADCLFSFRKNFGVKKAIAYLCSAPESKRAYSYKIDVHNYFNSVDISLCLPMLQEILADDCDLYKFIAALLSDPYVSFEGNLITEEKGIMAGTPISSFLANIYLSQLDRYFQERGVLYARYSDDIIVFAENREDLECHRRFVLSFLEKMKLEINPEKEVYTEPNQPWTFLGIQYFKGDICLSRVSLKKLKSKMRRKANSLIRWKHKKQLESRHAARAYVKYLNRYFYSNSVSGEMTWARWYFPILTTERDLHEIDSYAQEMIRFVYFEQHKKSNYNLRYEQLKELGYRPLVAEYYNTSW